MFEWLLIMLLKKTETFKMRLRLAKSLQLLQRAVILVFHEMKSNFKSVFKSKSKTFKKMEWQQMSQQICVRKVSCISDFNESVNMDQLTLMIYILISLLFYLKFMEIWCITSSVYSLTQTEHCNTKDIFRIFASQKQ